MPGLQLLIPITVYDPCFFIQVYSNLEEGKSHVVNTSWAMLALIDAGQVRILVWMHCIQICNLVKLLNVLFGFKVYLLLVDVAENHS